MKLRPKNMTGYFIKREDGRIEEQGIHGIGHPSPNTKYPDNVHGCDGCCTDQYDEVALGRMPKRRTTGKYKPSRRGQG